MAQFKIETLLIPLALAGIGFAIWQAMKKNGGDKGNGTKYITDSKRFSLTPQDLTPELKAACNASYKPIGANRYLCYRGLKQPTVPIEGVSGVFL